MLRLSGSIEIATVSASTSSLKQSVLETFLVSSACLPIEDKGLCERDEGEEGVVLSKLVADISSSIEPVGESKPMLRAVSTGLDTPDVTLLAMLDMEQNTGYALALATD